MFAALRRKVFGILQVISLHSALSKSNMQVHNLRSAGEGRYLVRVSVAPKGLSGTRKVAIGNTSPFANKGIMSRVSGQRSRIANEDKFASYFAEAMEGSGLPSGEDEQDEMSLAVYGEFNMERGITTRKASDWGLRAMLRNFGCDVENAEMVQDGGYGSQWIAVAFNPA